jgi:hypothetical protein
MEMELNTPIRQITGIPSTPTSELICIRSWDGATFLKVEWEEELKWEVMSQQRFAKSPMDIAFHSSLVGEAAIVLDGGTLCLWDMNREQEER